MDNFTTFTDRSLASRSATASNSCLLVVTILVLFGVCYCVATIEETICWTFCFAKARRKKADASLVTKKVQDHEEIEPCCEALEGLNTEFLTCPICIEPYVVGDEVSWSLNGTCNHVFHRSCIYEWILKHEKCPCCRCCYVMHKEHLPSKPQPLDETHFIRYFCRKNKITEDQPDISPQIKIRNDAYFCTVHGLVIPLNDQGVEEGVLDLESNSRTSNPDCGTEMEKPSQSTFELEEEDPDASEGIQIETVLTSRSECNSTVIVCVG